MNKKQLIVAGMFISLSIIALSGCASRNELAGTYGEGGEIAGFWLGLWHGIILPISLIISFFNKNINIYEVHNSGLGYNIGFLLGMFAWITEAFERGRKV